MGSPVLETSTLYRWTGTADSLKGETSTLAFLLKDRSLPAAAAMFTPACFPKLLCGEYFFVNFTIPEFWLSGPKHFYIALYPQPAIQFRTYTHIYVIKYSEKVCFTKGEGGAIFSKPRRETAWETKLRA